MHNIDRRVQGSDSLLDYCATKGAIVAFIRGLALQLVKRGIRVNGVAPGPIWTPLIPASFDEEEVQRFGNEVPMQRAGQSYVRISQVVVHKTVSISGIRIGFTEESHILTP